MADLINHTEVTRERRQVSANHGRTRHNDWYDYAPVTHPAIGQNTFHCHRCGDLVLEIPEHDTFHERIDAMLEWYDAQQNSAPVPSDKISEPVKSRPRSVAKETE